MWLTIGPYLFTLQYCHVTTVTTYISVSQVQFGVWKLDSIRMTNVNAETGIYMVLDRFPLLTTRFTNGSEFDLVHPVL